MKNMKKMLANTATKFYGSFPIFFCRLREAESVLAYHCTLGLEPEFSEYQPGTLNSGSSL